MGMLGLRFEKRNVEWVLLKVYFGLEIYWVIASSHIASGIAVLPNIFVRVYDIYCILSPTAPSQKSNDIAQLQSCAPNEQTNWKKNSKELLQLFIPSIQQQPTQFIKSQFILFFSLNDLYLVSLIFNFLILARYAESASISSTAKEQHSSSSRRFGKTTRLIQTARKSAVAERILCADAVDAILGDTARVLEFLEFSVDVLDLGLFVVCRLNAISVDEVGTAAVAVWVPVRTLEEMDSWV
jgi:hypothetical protein